MSRGYLYGVTREQTPVWPLSRRGTCAIVAEAVADMRASDEAIPAPGNAKRPQVELTLEYDAAVLEAFRTTGHVGRPA